MTTTTSPGRQGTEPAGLVAVARRLESWRVKRGRGKSIPAELWQAAGELARIHGLNPTAAALRLNYYDLQRRMRGGPVARRGRRRSATFIEVPALPLPANGGEVGTVELVQGSGARLILRLPQAAAKDLLPVVQLFLRRRP